MILTVVFGWAFGWALWFTWWFAWTARGKVDDPLAQIMLGSCAGSALVLGVGLMAAAGDVPWTMLGWMVAGFGGVGFPAWWWLWRHLPAAPVVE